MNDTKNRSEAGAASPFRTPYPAYDVLEKWDTPSFNEQTRRVISDRLHNVPPRRFLDEDQYDLLRAVVDCILPQPERPENRRIPVAAFIDAMLFDNQGSGTRYADTLAMREAWPRGLAAIDGESRGHFGRGFRELDDDDRHTLLKRIDNAEIDADLWTGLHPKRFFRHVLLKESVKIYYAHPWAMNEIGFGGPAAPRGYVRLGPDDRDPWEAEETRTPQRLERLP